MAIRKDIMPEDVKDQEVQEVVQGEYQPEEVITSEEQEVNGELPDSASERTRREFEKLKEHNRQLAEKVAAYESNKPKQSLLETYFEQPVMPQAQPQMPQIPLNATQDQIQEIKNSIYNSEGYIDEAEFNKRLDLINKAEKRAAEAERKAQEAMEKVARFEVDSQTKQIYKEFPQLDPSNDNFDQDAFDLVRKELVDQLINHGTRDGVAAARKMSKYFSKPSQTESQKQVLDQRIQATSRVGSGKARSAEAQDYESLRKASMTSDQAMEERIRRAGI